MSKRNVHKHNIRGWKILSLMIGLFLGFSIRTGHAQAADCTQWSGGTIANGASVYGYSTVLRTITGQNYPSTCTPFSGLLTCASGTIIGNFNVYKYTAAQCAAGLPKSCLLPRGVSVPHATTTTGYSATGVSYPGSCDDVASPLSCMNGNLNGNRQTYGYNSCASLNQLVPGIDLEIVSTFSGLPAGGTGIAQGSSPMITLALRNNGTTLVNATAGAGFVTCTWTDQGLNIYSSPALGTLIVNPGTKIALPIQLKSIFTQVQGEKHISCTINFSDVNASNNTWTATYGVTSAQRFDLAMETSIQPIKQNLDAAEGASGVAGLKNLVFSKVMSFLVPLVVVIGILIALIGFYKVMFSSDDKALGEGTKYITFGVLGIIVIMSAKFIGSNIYTILTPTSGGIQGFEIAQSLYDKIFFPFIKIAVYLVLGAMFVILVSRVIGFVFGKDDDTKKKAGTIIGWNILGMLVIIGAKQIVEAVYGKQADVVKAISNLGEVGTGILADKNIPIVYQVVNRVLGLTALILLILIIVQTIQLLINPSDEKQMTKVKNTILYMAIGIFVIGAGYLIVNFLIIN